MASGRRVGRYEIVREIRREYFGTVHEANDLAFERTVSLKLPHPELRDDEMALARVELEAKVLARLSRTWVPDVYELRRTEDGVPFLSFEELRGETLQTLLAGSDVSFRRRLSFLERACRGVDELHRHEVVHRNLKPFNLIVTPDDLVKFLDFGCVRWLRVTSPAASLMGTVEYMAPEQVKGLPVDGRADVYSLGVVLYEILTGRTPFAGDNVQETFFRVLHADPPRLVEKEPGTAGAFQEVVDRALAKNRDDRFATAEELADAVRGLIDGPAKELPPLERFEVEGT